jgi:hypothetical protein
MRAQVRDAHRASIRAAVMYGCVLEAYSWGYLLAPPVPSQDIVDELALEVRTRKATARDLRRQARTAKRAARRLDLPEQIW